MAKELPYFKFEPSEWENGNIQICSREDKGLFMDLCAIYWSRLGDLPEKLAIQKLCGGNATAMRPLCDEGIIEITDGFICIHFLNEQLLEFEETSNQNRENARKGWEKRRKIKPSDRNATASNPQSETDAIREEKRRGNKRREEKSAAPKKLSKVKLEDFPWQSEQFLEAWKGWLIYRKEIKKSFKSERSEKTALGQLAKLTLETDSNGSDTTAVEIITRSIANSWTGLFALDKSKSNGNTSTEDELKKGMDYINRKYSQSDHVANGNGS